MPDDPADNTRHDTHEQKGETAAQDVPLVRTEGKEYQNGAVWSVDRMLRDPHLLRDMRDDDARRAEAAFGLQPSLYFYVGHTCPAFSANANAWVFVFAADAFDGATGSMTHFDTGGFYKKLIHLDREVDRAAYLAEHRIDDLAGWRDKFRAYVKEHFSSAQAYVLGERATKADPYGRLLHPKNRDPRAWTWEMQLHADHDVRLGLLRLWVTSGAYDRLVQAVVDLPDAAERRRWKSTVEASVRTAPALEESSSICQLAVQEIASWQ